MRKTLIAATGLAVAAGLLAPAAVANAAPLDSSNTTVTLSVPNGTGGNLTISAAGSISLLANLSQTNVVGSFGTVTGISDNRTNLRPRTWVASVAMSDLQGPDGSVISADSAYYKVDGATWDSNGTRENLAADWTKLGTGEVPVYKRGGQDLAIVQYTSWTPHVKVEFPTATDGAGNVLPAVRPGSYAGTLTTSVI